jgi:ADP-dependent NAD(P)H-hydrate dehydratase
MEKVTEIPKLPERPPDTHKGDVGRVLIVGGSLGMSGAAAIAGTSALRSGAGLVRVAVPKSILPIVASIEPCYTTLPLPEDENGCMSSDAVGIVLEQASQNDVVAFGPGAGLGRGVTGVLSELINQENLRLVVDADGLNCLSKMTGTAGWVETKKARMIITPHPGEMKRLWSSVFREQFPPDRSEQAIKLAQNTGCVVVLKGAGTVVTNGEKVYVNTTGNPGMATAGSGDVLTGVIAALCGQGMNDFDAAIAGVYLHGLAGDIAAKQKGQISLIATDIIDCLPQAFQQY